MGIVGGGTETSCEVPMKAEGGESESPLTIGMTGEVKMSFHRLREAHDDDGDHKQHELLKGFKKIRKVRGSTAKERISRMPPCTAGKRSSIYRGVTRHRWTGRYEAHLWDKSSWNQNQNKKGKQVYLGAYDDEEAAARAYDLAALKYWGPGTLINFPISDYARDVEEMQKVSREEYLASLRRKSSSCSRASSKFRGMNRSSSSGQWELNLGQMLNNTYFNSGICSTSAEAATACEYGGNFNVGRRIDLTSYIKWWKPSKGVPTATDKGQITLGIGLANQKTEPYQLPTLGVSFKGKAQTVVTACELLSQSAAFRYMKEKVKASKDVVPSVYDMNDKKLSLIEKSKMPLEISVVNTLSLQRNPYSVFSLTSSQIMGECSSLDPLADSILWSSILPPTGLYITNTHQQSDPNSACTLYGQD